MIAPLKKENEVIASQLAQSHKDRLGLQKELKTAAKYIN